MTIKSTTPFTPEVLLSIPRRSAGIPNHDASKILYTVTSYSFDKHEGSSEIRVLDSRTNESKLITDDKEASDPVWLDSEEQGEGLVVLLKGVQKGATQVLVGDPEDWSQRRVYLKCGCRRLLMLL